MTTEAAEAEVRADEDPGWPEGPERQYYGHVIIEWPAPRQAAPGFAHVMPAWGCAIYDAITGKPVTAEKITVTADVKCFIICELVMFADEDGMPIMGPGDDGKLTLFKDGNDRIKTGVFPFYVSEMRVRS